MQYSFSNHRKKKKKGHHDHRDLYGKPNTVDITEGNPLNDARIIQFKREIKQLKEKIELQAEYTRKLEKDNNELASKLESYKRRCSDLQKTLDDKDQHLNDVLSKITAEHSVMCQYSSIFKFFVFPHLITLSARIQTKNISNFYNNRQ